MKKVIGHKQIYKAFKGFTAEDKAFLADKLGTSVNMLTQYIDGFKAFSWKRALEVERLTGIPKHVLRPDIYSSKKEVA